MEDIFEILSNHILYVVLGFIFLKILRKFKLKQTRNNFFWHDLLDKYTIHAQIIDHENDIVYYGRIALIEVYNHHPQIILTEYEWYSKGELKDNFSGHPEQTVLIDTSQYKDIKLIFDSNSDIINLWSNKDNEAFVKECIKSRCEKPDPHPNPCKSDRDDTYKMQKVIPVKVKRTNKPCKHKK